MSHIRFTGFFINHIVVCVHSLKDRKMESYVVITWLAAVNNPHACPQCVILLIWRYASFQWSPVGRWGIIAWCQGSVGFWPEINLRLSEPVVAGMKGMLGAEAWGGRAVCWSVTAPRLDAQVHISGDETKGWHVPARRAWSIHIRTRDLHTDASAHTQST